MFIDLLIALRTIEERAKESEDASLKDIKRQLSQINVKLSNVMEKNDGSLRTMIKETISVMKEDLLESVIKRIEMLERYYGTPAVVANYRETHCS